jgi:hypothetical protein
MEKDKKTEVKKDTASKSRTEKTNDKRYCVLTALRVDTPSTFIMQQTCPQEMCSIPP